MTSRRQRASSPTTRRDPSRPWGAPARGRHRSSPLRARPRPSVCSPTAPSTCSWWTTGMPGRTGLELIAATSPSQPEGERPQVIMMTAYATVENAIGP